MVELIIIQERMVGSRCCAPALAPAPFVPHGVDELRHPEPGF